MIVAANRLPPRRPRNGVVRFDPAASDASGLVPEATPEMDAFCLACKTYGPQGSLANARGKTARGLYHATATLCTLKPEERQGFLDLVSQQVRDLELSGK